MPNTRTFRSRQRHEALDVPRQVPSGDVPEADDQIIQTDPGAPALQDHAVHLVDGGERPTEEVQPVDVAQMQIGPHPHAVVVDLQFATSPGTAHRLSTVVEN